jgi:hypothetical protein
LNLLEDDVQLVAGTNISIATDSAANTITISSTGGDKKVASVIGTDGIKVTTDTGGNATVGIDKTGSSSGSVFFLNPTTGQPTWNSAVTASNDGTLNIASSLFAGGGGFFEGGVNISGTSGSASLSDGNGFFSGSVTASTSQFFNLMVIGSSGPTGITLSGNGDASFSGTVTAQSVVQTSSRRWKTNIHPIEGALDKVMRLRGVSYHWKADGRQDIGVIAEEVGEVVPEVVKYAPNGADAEAVDYAHLVALLIEGMKEQQKEIESLKMKTVELERTQSEVKDLKAQMAQLASAVQRLAASSTPQGNSDGRTKALAGRE